MTETIIEITDLSKTYGKMKVLDKLNLRVEKGSITGFLGPNGAGKSTSIMILLGLIRADSGSINLFGTEKKQIGYLAQHPRFHPWMSARDVLRFTARFFHRKITREVNEWIGESLEMAGLYEKANQRAGAFSGGELQRLGLAQAWINRPELLILDEPAASLDPAGRYDVLNIMQEMKKHCTIFYSTHILEDVERISDKVIILNRGKAVFQGPATRLLSGNRCRMLVRFRESSPGTAEQTRKRIEKEPWVDEITSQEESGSNGWIVQVNDRDIAERKLLPFITEEPDLQVYHFEEMKQRLEEMFLKLTTGDKNND
jgi:ABC-2 type transport system ATP-binding protein